MDVSEVEHMDENQVYFAHDLYEDWMDDAIGQMTPNVYITIDLDAFDPSILPSTGTPEPGGMFYYETLEFLQMMFKKKNVVGFDIVELCPNDIDKSSDFLAAKLYYKMLSYKFKFENHTPEDDE
jgi:agmatinase